MNSEKPPIVPGRFGTSAASPLEFLRSIPEEDVWLHGQRSEATRRAYRRDVVEFAAFHRITSADELRVVSTMAVIAWRRHLEGRNNSPKTIRRKLAGLSSLFGHLVRTQVLTVNPAREVERPRINRRTGTTPAFSPSQAARLLDAPNGNTLIGKRDRAILALGLRVGPRQGEIARLRVRDLHHDRGFDCLRFRLKGGTENSVAIHPAVSVRIREYLAAAGHEEDLDGPMFRPTRPAWGLRDMRRHLYPQVIDHVLKKYVAALRLVGHYSSHSMRATFITTTLENGASLEEVQRAVGHADPDTTKLYDRRGFKPEKSASFYANY